MQFKMILNIISNRSIWPTDVTLTSTNTLSVRVDQGVMETNEWLHSTQSFRTYYDVTVQHTNHYAVGSPSEI